MAMLRRLFKFVAYLLLVAVVLIAVFLAKAHWQVRQVQTPLPTERTIRATLSDSETPSGIRIINTASQDIPESSSLAYPAFVIEWSDGRTLLIDVGMEPAGAIEFGKLIESLLNAGPVTTFGSVGEQLAGELANIAGVVFTHLHEDHTGGLGSLCSDVSRAIPVFQTPQQAELQNYTTRVGHEVISNTKCIRPSRLTGAGPVYKIPGFPGVFAFAAGGHTPGSTVFFVRIDDTLWVFSGDMTNNKKSIVENLAKPTLYSLLVTPEAMGRLREIRVWLAELDSRPDITVVVSHDLAELERLPIPMVEAKRAE